MKVALKLFAFLSKYLPAEAQRTNRVELVVEPGTSVEEIIERYRLPPELCSLVLLNGTFVPPQERRERTLSEGDVLAIWPPVAGG